MERKGEEQKRIRKQKWRNGVEEKRIKKNEGKGTGGEGKDEV